MEGIEAKAEALINVCMISGCLKIATVQLILAVEDLDKTVTAVLSDSNLVDADHRFLDLERSCCFVKKVDEDKQLVSVVGNDYGWPFIASNPETESTVTGLTVGDKVLENFEPGKTY